MPEPTHGAIEIREQPCPYCAAWIGPHRHWLRADGSLGMIVDSLDEPDRLDNASRTLGLMFAEALGLDAMVAWLDRQLQRSPRLYRWLSR